MPTELSESFSRKQWKDCCGKGCKKCAIAHAYTSEFGRKKGLEVLNEDRAAAKKGKGAKKSGGKQKAVKAGAKGAKTRVGGKGGKKAKKG